LCARHELADALLELGRLDEAEREYQTALAGRNKPTYHYCTLTCQFGLARVMSARGDLDEAQTHHKELLATKVEVFGDDHPETLDSRFELATLLSRRGETTAAITAHRAVLDARIRVLGPDHPDTTRSRTALAFEEGTSTQ
jgi:hypothetical protein